jgi:hypothetical protein
VEYHGFTVYSGNDLFIEFESDYGCGTEAIWLKEALDAQIEETEKYLSKASAMDFYEAICILESHAREMREKFEKWKYDDFEKPAT